MTSLAALESSFGEQTSMLIGNRIPKDFFVTSGVGQSDITIHAGSYHLALLDARIEHCNIMTYSSILPKIARKLDNFDPKKILHGSVLETITAVKSVEGVGNRATAAIMWGWLIDRKTDERCGGLVCEYSETGSEEEAKQSLAASLDELYTHGYQDRFHLTKTEFHSRSIIAQKRYATALVTLGFINYLLPILETAEAPKRKR
ncbi:pyruvoyl-dependent arginine decarboxylase [Candidatus Woesearchaeota archaeon]|nr:pyruvoyl-dependent arginine decarboxylase [Candidatus Woesearchaeota archaeon]